MFSYRHAFHVGNHGDVLKHVIFVHTLDYFNRKDTPYWVIDSHAGAGHYALDDAWASQNAEWADGVGRLWQYGEALSSDLPAMLTGYLRRIQRYNDGSSLQHYPGSPWLALDALRSCDRLRLFEQHPNEAHALATNLAQRPRAQQRQTTLYSADGFSGIKALLPPPTRRGLILIDPSYEDKRDYHRVLEALRAGLQRFATGCYAIWYPHVSRREAIELPRQLAKLPVNWLHTSLTVRHPDPSGHGLHGSGMFLVNPPWTLAAALREALPWLARKLAQDDHATYTLTVSQA